MKEYLVDVYVFNDRGIIRYVCITPEMKQYNKYPPNRRPSELIKAGYAFMGTMTHEKFMKLPV